MNFSRRRFLFKAGVTLAGAGAGYVAGKFVGSLGGSLEAAVTAFYNVAHDTLTEITGAAERQLQKSADDVQSYLTSVERDHASVQKYWEDIGLLSGKEAGELQKILAKVEGYTEESDIQERLTRLKDRLTKRLTNLDQGLEQIQPEGLQRFNEWFSRKIKGEEQGSRQSLKHYKERLGALVQVYDINKDNKVAQTVLLNKTSDYFLQTQQIVVQKINDYLAGNQFESPEERDFFVQLKQVADADLSGRNLADYLLNTGNYFTLLETSEQVHQLKDKLGKTLDDIVTLQGALDKGIELKDTLRAASDQDLTALRKQAQDLEAYMTTKKDELVQEGYVINYELFPKMQALKDGLLRGLDTLKTVSGAVGAAVGAVGMFVLADRTVSGKRATRRELITLHRDNQAPTSLINDKNKPKDGGKP
ncbi:MAG TPA: hypothetical protein VJH37_05290 [Candidatus Nanoarchaeia archaeon]|nr:hypothetical protein [Candidatus Nanoarchaeia archaeon]